MNNFTYENQGTNTYLVYTIQPDDSIDSMSLGMLTNNKINGLTPAIFTQVDTEKYIKYNVSAKVSVKQFFSGPVNKKRLISVFRGIVDAMFSAEEYMIDTDSILLDLEYIFSDVSSCDTSLICLPVIREQEEQVDLGDFFKRIMFSTQFDQTENCDHVAKLINYLNSTPIFSLADFSKVLDALQEEKTTATIVQTIVVQKEETPQQVQPSVPVNRTVTVQKEQAKEGNKVPPVMKNVESQPSVPEKKPEPVKNGEKEISLFYLLQHYNKDNAAAYKAQKEAKKEAQKGAVKSKQDIKGNDKGKKDKKSQPTEVNFMIPGQESVAAVVKEHEEKVQPAIQPKINNNSRQGEQVKAQENTAKETMQTSSAQQGEKTKNFGETVVLNPEMRGETTVLSMEKNPAQASKVYLVRTKNNENIILDKPTYRIGTERSYVDYFISDNSAVSRGHANIVSRNNMYYIVDTNSRNHTFVNGEMISSNVEVQLEHGDIIRLANEEFEFKLH